jgi:GWxTD domain-containing protein
MTWLELWTETSLAKALAWTLLHSLWEGAAAALLLAAAMCVLHSARARYVAACAALLALLIGFTITLARLWPVGVGSPGPHVAALPGPAEIDFATSDPIARYGFRAADLLPWIAPFWMLGVLAFQLRSLAGWVAARRLRRSGICCAAADWTARLERLAARIRISRPVMLFESSLAEAPLVIGYLRPVILMPAGLLVGLPAAQVEAILAHELAHILRQDYLINLAQTFVEGLLFYHPAVWWISHVIRAERENCCDDVAVAVSGNARQYAAALAALEQNRIAASELALAATGGSLVKRVRRILESPERSRVGFAPLASALVLTLATAAGLTAWQATPTPKPQAAVAPVAEQVAPPVSSAPVESQTPAAQTHPSKAQIAALIALRVNAAIREQLEAALAQQAPLTQQAPPMQQAVPLSNPYKKWLNEDVAYIITNEERAAYKSLASDAQHEAFIEDFWLKRDPTPGTQENEFKDEHYRRIAYANEHFASTIPGWKTDRGRIYITFGPPDEIEDHSKGGTYQRPPSEGGGETTVFPFQQWRYKHIDGVGDNIIVEFVDPTYTGEYRMTVDPAEKDALRYVALNSPPPVNMRPGNSFISVGGDPQVTVNVGSGGTVAVIVEQSAVAGRWDYTMSIGSNGKNVANLRDSKKIGAAAVGTRFTYNSGFHLDAGSYTLNVTVKDPTGATQTKSVSFYVN